MNGPTGALGLGWHRVTWTDPTSGQQQYVVTQNIVSAALVQSAMLGRSTSTHARIESWSDYPYDPETGACAPDPVSRETLKGA